MAYTHLVSTYGVFSHLLYGMVNHASEVYRVTAPQHSTASTRLASFRMQHARSAQEQSAYVRSHFALHAVAEYTYSHCFVPHGASFAAPACIHSSVT